MEGIDGHQASVFYTDGNNVSRKDGKILSYDEQNLILLTPTSQNIIIPKERIIRIEIHKEDKT